MIRLLALDIDGTLLDSKGQLPPQNRDAVARFVGSATFRLERDHLAGLGVLGAEIKTSTHAPSCQIDGQFRLLSKPAGPARRGPSPVLGA